MPDLINDEFMTLSDAGRRLPGRPHASTVWRWCRVGVRGVRLRYRRLGRRIVVCPAALDEFTRRLAALDEAQHHAAPAPSPARSGTAAHGSCREAEADAMGL